MSTARQNRHDRPFDVVLFGATGFTGTLVAHELARHYDLEWALAGRNASKLETLRADLATKHPGNAALRSLPILVADSADKGRLDEVAAQTRVICTTVGPYDLLGEPLVAACVDQGTDYCDLTGETPFIRRMVDTYHDRAVASGARIVHCCGFDSIPSDIGTFVLQREALRRFGRPAERVRFHMRKATGGFSGGTVASMLNMVEQLKDKAVRRIVADPYSLNPEGERSGPDARDGIKPERDATTGRWVGPLVMGPVNTRVVRRSHALRGFPWGKDFRYDEVMSFGRGPSGFAKAVAMSGGLVGFMAALSVPALKGLLERRVLPKPGEGPSEKVMRDGFFEAELVGTAGDHEIHIKVKGRGDPGYGATSRMLAESALALAFDTPQGTLPAGVLTPSTALGEALVERLAKTDVTFTVE